MDCPAGYQTQDASLMIKAEQIKRAKFVDLERTMDDGDWLYSGLLQITLTDGTKKEYRCDYIRQGHRDDVKALDKQNIVDYIACYEPEEIF